MGRLPKFSKPKISTEVGVAPSSPGNDPEGRELEKLGGMVAQFGANLLNKQREAASESEAISAKERYLSEVGELQRSARSVPDAHVGYSETLNPDIRDLKNRISEELSPEASRKFKNSISNRHSSILASNIVDEAKMKSKYYSAQADTMGRNRAVTVGPDYFKANDLLIESHADLNSMAEKGMIFPETVESRKKEMGKYFRDSVLGSMQREGNWDQMTALINGGVQKTEVLLNGMSPQEKNVWMGRAEAGLKAENAKKTQLVSLGVSGARVLSLQGNLRDEDAAEVKKAILGSSLTPEVKRIKLDEMENNIVINRAIKTVNTMDGDTMNSKSIDDLLVSSGITSEVQKERARLQFVDAIKSMKNKENKDFQQYHSEENTSYTVPQVVVTENAGMESLESSAISSLAVQKNRGVKNTRVLSKDNSRRQGNYYNSVDNYEFKAKVIDNIISTYGDASPYVINDLIKDGYMGEEVRIVSNFDSLGAKERMLQVLKNGKEIKESLHGKEYNNLIQSVEAETSDYSAYYRNYPDSAKFINSYNNAIALTALEYERGPRQMSQKEAIKAAKKDILEDSYSLYSSRHGDVAIPKKYTVGNEDTLNAMLRNGMSNRILKLAGVDVLATKAAQNGLVKDENEYYNIIREGGKWGLNAQQDALVLHVPSEILSAKLPKGTTRKLPDSNGSTVEFKLKDLASRYNPMKEYTSELAIESPQGTAFRRGSSGRSF